MEGVHSDGVRKFLGIPYAAPPLGTLRWRRPQAPSRWGGVRRFTTAGPQCMQSPCVPALSAVSQSEDCLTLNIFAPNTYDNLVPVRVWFHGGGYGVGNAIELTASKLIDGLPFCQQGLLLVTVQFRLGAFGYLSLPSVFPEARGTLGLQDQQQALRWIRDNIASFGGDPNQVTIWGESAGGGSVMHHLASPPSWGLFRRAILESPWAPTMSKAQAEQQGRSLASALGCNPNFNADQAASCLRSKTSQQVENAIALKTWFLLGPGAVFVPVEDGEILLGPTSARIRDGNVPKDIQVLAGTNLNEGTMFVYQTYLFEMSAQQYYDAVRDTWVEKADQIVRNYPSSSYGGARAALSEALHHAAFLCPLKMMAEGLEKASVMTFLYLFADSTSNVPPLGVYHGAETFFVFGQPFLAFTSGQAQLSDTMRTYFDSFTKTGSPNNGNDLARWNAYHRVRPSRILFDETISEDLSLARYEGTCQFWDFVLVGNSTTSK